MPAKSLTAVRRAAAKAAQASQHRNDTIRAAHENGETLRAIAASAGLSFARIHQIVREK